MDILNVEYVYSTFHSQCQAVSYPPGIRGKQVGGGGGQLDSRILRAPGPTGPADRPEDLELDLPEDVPEHMHVTNGFYEAAMNLRGRMLKKRSTYLVNFH